MRTAKTLIILCGCPGWSEFSLGAHAILLVLSWGGSYTWRIHRKWDIVFYTLKLIQSLLRNGLTGNVYTILVTDFYKVTISDVCDFQFPFFLYCLSVVIYNKQSVTSLAEMHVREMVIGGYRKCRFVKFCNYFSTCQSQMHIPFLSHFTVPVICVVCLQELKFSLCLLLSFLLKKKIIKFTLAH